MTDKIDKIEQNMANRCTMKNTVSMARLTGDTDLPECKPGVSLADGWVDDHTDGESTRQPNRHTPSRSTSRLCLRTTQRQSGPRQPFLRHWVQYLLACGAFFPATGHAAAGFTVGNTVLEPCVPTVVLTANASGNELSKMDERNNAWSAAQFFSVLSGAQLRYQRPSGWQPTGTDYTKTPLHSWAPATGSPIPAQVQISSTVTGCNIDTGGWAEVSTEGVYIRVEGSSSMTVNYLIATGASPGGVQLLWQMNTNLSSNGISSYSKGALSMSGSFSKYDRNLLWPSFQAGGFTTYTGIYTSVFSANPNASTDFAHFKSSYGWPGYMGNKYLHQTRHVTSASWRIVAVYAPLANRTGANSARLAANSFTVSGNPRRAAIPYPTSTTVNLPTDMVNSPDVTLTLMRPKPTCAANIPSRVVAGNIATPLPGGEVRLLGQTSISVTCTNSAYQDNMAPYQPGVIFSGATGPITTNPARLTTTTPGLVVVGRHQKQAARSCALTPDRDDVLFDGKTKYLPSDGSMAWTLSKTPNEITSKSTAISWYVCAPGTTAPNPGPFSAKAAWSVVLN